MTELSDASESYLRRLGEGLQPLPSDETKEILAEVRSHLAEAIKEPDGSEVDVLARFGSPDLLALRILQERGILGEGAVIPGASPWLRALAFAADIALGVLTCMLVLLINDFAGSRILPFAGEFGHFRFFSVWAWLIVAAGVAVCWWIQGRRRRSHATLGMRIVGLRRLRMGPTSLVVAQRDVPGLLRKRRSPIAIVARTVFALALLSGVCYWFFSVAGVGSYAMPPTDAANLPTQGSYTGAVRTVTEIYGLVLAGEPSDELERMLAAGEEAALSQLEERRATGTLDRYSIEWANLAPGYAPLAPPGSTPTQDVVILVQVAEYGKDSPIPALYECRLVETWKSVGPNAATSDGFRLESIRLVSQRPPE